MTARASVFVSFMAPTVFQQPIRKSFDRDARLDRSCAGQPEGCLIYSTEVRPSCFPPEEDALPQSAWQPSQSARLSGGLLEVDHRQPTRLSVSVGGPPNILSGLHIVNDRGPSARGMRRSNVRQHPSGFCGF